MDRAGSALIRTVRPILGSRFRVAGRVDPQPFFIVGSGRSGNTLVRRILNESPSIHIPPETFVLGRVIGTFERNSHQPWSILVALVLSTFEYHPGFEDFGVVLRPLHQELMASPREKRTLAHIIDAFYRFHGKATGARFERWGDKTPLNAYYLDRIHRLFPDAQYVHVLRDGIDVVHSYVTSGLLGDIEDACTRWTTSVQAIGRFARRHPGSVFEVRYEALVSNAEATTRGLCDFLGQSFDESFLAVPERDLGDVEQYSHHARVRLPVSPDRIGAGRRGLAGDDLLHMNRNFIDQLEQCGYPPPASETPGERAEP